ncbi:MAG: YbaN family protein [Actinomycetota bacterium]
MIDPVDTGPIARPDRARWLRPLFLVVGLLSLAIAIAGIVLPLVPTTPLVLVAAYCFARSSERLHSWLVGHPRLGRYISDFEAGRGIPIRAKVIALVMASVAFAYGFTVVADKPIAIVVLAVVALWAIVTILRVPSYPTSDSE